MCRWYLGYTIGVWYFGCHACALVLSHRLTGRGPRRSSSFSGMVGRLPGLSGTTFKGPVQNGEEEDENSVEEEESDGTEGVLAPVGAFQGTQKPTLAQSNKPSSHQSEPSLLAIMQ
ncbi:hypothetical protein O181_094813 [Austropuccinia psidii MF-1]|uniref:Uncharacterized protein n=1 Tax=Austropuccinia psidii MF-1 TaxID=1389203 RepID=A0A9Q3J2Q6_9BASI|nr:hypothetical protein [Austropuccinia psidii MF-1]